MTPASLFLAPLEQVHAIPGSAVSFLSVRFLDARVLAAVGFPSLKRISPSPGQAGPRSTQVRLQNDKGWSCSPEEGTAEAACLPGAQR